MAKTTAPVSQTNPEAFQAALDALDVVGRWEWDAATDRARTDAFVGLLFNIDPEVAEEGVALAAFIDAIHGDDRDRVLSLIRQTAQAGDAYLTEYRVVSADGRTRWVLARGRFVNDAAGRPLRGSGILVDITRMRVGEGTSAASDTEVVEGPLERAADHTIAAHKAIAELKDASLKSHVEALLLALGCRLAQKQVRERRRFMH